MLGYYRNDELTAETIRDGWLYTGDLGYMSDGELFVCGRVKDVIIVHGRKYHPQDLEWAVGELAGIRRGRVAAFATSEHGASDRVVLVVEPSGTVEAARAGRGDSAAHQRGVRALRRRDRARLERHDRPDDERQGAAGGDQGALRARRAGRARAFERRGLITGMRFRE